MTTPIVILILLLAPWVAGRAAGRSWAAYGPVAVFAFTGVGHFIATAPMVEMLPAWVPFPSGVVLASGVFELLLAACLALPASRRAAGRVAVAFLVLVLPLNVYAAINGIGPGGHAWGPVYLWIRVPLQGILIAACYRWSIRGEDPNEF